ncbi:MAG: hypothetical protein IOC49_02855 [Methylobacterium sp.]|nr:hypothetical protein [Methylobacterium sp.]
MSIDEINALKRAATGDAAFADRLSFALVVRFAQLQNQSGDYESVLDEIRYLESGIPTSTKPATQFRYPPLKPFWHKHFFCPQHLIRNVGERWNIARGSGNRDLDTMIADVAREQGHDPELWPKLLVHRLWTEALEERSNASRMTGHWIIFAKHEGQKYYLDLATHEEGEAGGSAEQLFKKLKLGCFWEFPFLFKHD